MDNPKLCYLTLLGCWGFFSLFCENWVKTHLTTYRLGSLCSFRAKVLNVNSLDYNTICKWPFNINGISFSICSFNSARFRPVQLDNSIFFMVGLDIIELYTRFLLIVLVFSCKFLFQCSLNF